MRRHPSELSGSMEHSLHLLLRWRRTGRVRGDSRKPQPWPTSPVTHQTRGLPFRTRIAAGHLLVTSVPVRLGHCADPRGPRSCATSADVGDGWSPRSFDWRSEASGWPYIGHTSAQSEEYGRQRLVVFKRFRR